MFRYILQYFPTFISNYLVGDNYIAQNTDSYIYEIVAQSTVALELFGNVYDIDAVNIDDLINQKENEGLINIYRAYLSTRDVITHMALTLYTGYAITRFVSSNTINKYILVAKHNNKYVVLYRNGNDASYYCFSYKK